MHPDLISALERERHAELLRARQFRDTARDDSVSLVPRRRTPVHHLRRAVGSALVAAGTRLMPPNQTTADWIVQASRRNTLP